MIRRTDPMISCDSTHKHQKNIAAGDKRHTLIVAMDPAKY